MRQTIERTPGSDKEAAFRVIESVYEAYCTLQPEKIGDGQLPEYLSKR